MELFFGRPLVQFHDYRNADIDIHNDEQLKKRWKMIMQLVYPAVLRLQHDQQQISDKSYNRNHNIQRYQIKPGTIVMKVCEGGYDFGKKRPPFQPAYEGPYMVVRVSRSSNYVLQEVSTGNLLDRSLPLAKLKILDKVKPVRVVAERKNDQRELEKCLLFNDQSLLWVSKDADILQRLPSLEEGEVVTRQRSTDNDNIMDDN